MLPKGSPTFSSRGAQGYLPRISSVVPQLLPCSPRRSAFNPSCSECACQCDGPTLFEVRGWQLLDRP
ncbi:hypothetical protein CGRA01v4_06114 [Colletotrichum graminicola]|nr:hypothetical protein CGRA01v4_06114 [Colletotrichum graminicola]